MIRSCVLNFGGRWANHLPLIEFVYNNIYHSSVKMDPLRIIMVGGVGLLLGGLRLTRIGCMVPTWFTKPWRR